MEATNLDGDAVSLPLIFDKRVTMVAISFRSVGEQALATWLKPLSERVVASSRARNHTRLIQLTIIENSFARFFRSWILSNLAKLNSHPLATTTHLLRIGDSETQRNALRMQNRLAGYVFLVDHNAKVRFHASGAASEDDLKLLFDTTVDLVAERERLRL